MNLNNNPANDPWRNGMTDAQLMNLITLEGALDLVGKAKGAGLFNLEQDLELQNMITGICGPSGSICADYRL